MRMKGLRHAFAVGALLPIGGPAAFAQEWLSPRPTQAPPQQRPAQPQQQRPAQQQQLAPAQAAPQQGSQQTPAKPDLVQEIGDWRIQCFSKPARACQISQRQINSATKQLIVMLELTRRLGPNPQDVLAVMLPLGSRLSPVLSVRSEQTEVASVPLITCTQVGCVHSGAITVEKLDLMVRAKSLSTQLTNLRGQTVPLNISMRGFNDAFQKTSAFMKSG